MITRIAFDALALQPATGGALEQRLQSRRLAETVREFGLLSLLGEHDARELLTVLERLAESLGYDFWRPLIRALANGGPDVLRACPPNHASTRELLKSGDLDGLRSNADLVVVNSTGGPVSGLTGAQITSLYELAGFADAGGNLELALANAADQCNTVTSIKRLRSETVIPRGTPSTTLWETYFSPLARVSSEVNIFDRYLFSGLHRTGRQRADYLLWLLNALDRNLPQAASVNLFACSGQEVLRKSTRSHPTNPYTVHDISATLRHLDLWNRPGRLHLYLFDDLHHDRHIRFGCGSAVMPQQGFDQLSFPRGTLAKNFSYTFVSGGQSLSARADEEARARRSGRHWVLRSKRGGFEAVAP
ncbi:hypothetical protein FE374_18285 [Georgenia yuyongxinii]|uniref:Uncharacterized protein n=1 Tax=Georgenia yuyongxinii TaxID=2589797 RepID=A0A5B8C770_9MICO|nr:hypothetical protein [Georgenia yuyongxinii]QDC26298.1 hypothetical protein FE374_18285 [Georgenia yuyongxinii]